MDHDTAILGRAISQGADDSSPVEKIGARGGTLRLRNIDHGQNVALEQRRFRRFGCELPVRFLADGTWRDGCVSSVSLGGLQIHADSPLALHSHIRFELTVGDRLIAASGEVVHLATTDRDDRVALGIRFGALAPGAVWLLLEHFHLAGQI